MRGTYAGLALLLLVGLPDWAAAGAPCKPQPIAELDLAVTEEGSFLVPVSIGGEPVWMVLNTGGTITLLLQPAIERLHLDSTVVSGQAAGATVGKDEITRRTTLSTLTAGSHHYSPLVAGILPGTTDAPLVEVDGKPVVGYFGMEVLSRTDFELHLAQKKLRLFAADHCRGVGAYWTNDYSQTPFAKDPYAGIYFAMGLDGRLVETALSTGSAQTRVDADVAHKAFGFDANPPDTHVMALTMPGFNLIGVRIRLRKMSDDCGFRERIDSGSKAIAYGKCLAVFPLSLGRDVLQRMRLYVSLKERKIYFSEAGLGP